MSLWLMMRCLQDIMCNILMWVNIYDPFTSNLGIDINWNWLDYPWILIVPLSFGLYVESSLSIVKSAVVSYADCIHIVIQQTLTVESEVLHPTLPNRPLTLLQNPTTTEYCEIGCPSNWYTAFWDSSLSNISNILSLNPWNSHCCHSPRSQLYPPSRSWKIPHTDNSVPSGLRSSTRTRGIMNYLLRSHMQGRLWSTISQYSICLLVRVWYRSNSVNVRSSSVASGSILAMLT